jgi:hypothetical protein
MMSFLLYNAAQALRIFIARFCSQAQQSELNGLRFIVNKLQCITSANRLNHRHHNFDIYFTPIENIAITFYETSHTIYRQSDLSWNHMRGIHAVNQFILFHLDRTITSISEFYYETSVNWLTYLKTCFWNKFKSQFTNMISDHQSSIIWINVALRNAIHGIQIWSISIPFCLIMKHLIAYLCILSVTRSPTAVH